MHNTQSKQTLELCTTQSKQRLELCTTHNLNKNRIMHNTHCQEKKTTIMKQNLQNLEPSFTTTNGETLFTSLLCKA